MVGAAVSLFAGQGVKGKQVKDLYDLVTVNRGVALHYAIAKVRRRGAAMTRKSGNLPAIGTGWKTPGSRGIGRAEHHCFMQ